MPQWTPFPEELAGPDCPDLKPLRHIFGSLVYIFQHSRGILNPRGMQAYPFACHRASVVMRGKERCGARWLKAHLMRPAASDCLGMRREVTDCQRR